MENKEYINGKNLSKKIQKKTSQSKTVYSEKQIT